MVLALDSLPAYSAVPKDRQGNLRYRRILLRACLYDESLRREAWRLCARDPLWYANSFLWVYEPRIPEALPFITWDYQDEAILMLHNAVGHHDVYVEKSRDMGASWLTLFVLEHYWHFKDLSAFLVLSWKEDLVDKKAYPAALMWKFDFFHDPKFVPRWLIPNIERTHLHCKNRDNGSTLDGDTTTSDSGRAGRFTAIIADEIAKMGRDGEQIWRATRDVTNSRFAITTPRGISNIAYRIKLSPIPTVTLHWSRHPQKKRGLYRVTGGELEILDGDRFVATRRGRSGELDEWVFPKEYPFVRDGAFFKDGKYRSPWYDAECLRAVSPLEIGQELDIDYIGSGAVFFPEPLIETCRKENAQSPAWIGDFVCDEHTRMPVKPYQLHERPQGRLRLWIKPDIKGRFPDDRPYVLGADISQGTGATNSVISIGDQQTGEIVGKFVDPHLSPSDLAVFAAALGELFGRANESGKALIIWEANGPGGPFGKKLQDKTIGYGHIHWETLRTGRRGNVAGWTNTSGNLLQLLTDYRDGLSEGRIINRDDQALDECYAYQYDGLGNVVNAQSLDIDDPSGARENHADHVIADALVCRVLKKHWTAAPVERVIRPQHCYAVRREEYERAQRARVSW